MVLSNVVHDDQGDPWSNVTQRKKSKEELVHWVFA